MGLNAGYLLFSTLIFFSFFQVHLVQLRSSFSVPLGTVATLCLTGNTITFPGPLAWLLLVPSSTMFPAFFFWSRPASFEGKRLLGRNNILWSREFKSKIRYYQQEENNQRTRIMALPHHQSICQPIHLQMTYIFFDNKSYWSHFLKNILASKQRE